MGGSGTHRRDHREVNPEGPGPGGWFGSLIVGVLGAALGGWLGSAIFNIGLENFWSLQTWAVAILGSLLVLVIYGWLGERKS